MIFDEAAKADHQTGQQKGPAQKWAQNGKPFERQTDIPKASAERAEKYPKKVHGFRIIGRVPAALRIDKRTCKIPCRNRAVEGVWQTQYPASDF